MLKHLNILRDGSVGLMTDDYKALLLQNEVVGVYTNDDRYTPLEFSYYYLKEMFKKKSWDLMGFASRRAQRYVSLT